MEWSALRSRERYSEAREKRNETPGRTFGCILGFWFFGIANKYEKYGRCAVRAFRCVPAGYKQCFLSSTKLGL